MVVYSSPGSRPVGLHRSQPRMLYLMCLAAVYECLTHARTAVLTLSVVPVGCVNHGGELRMVSSAIPSAGTVLQKVLLHCLKKAGAFAAAACEWRRGAE